MSGERADGPLRPDAARPLVGADDSPDAADDGRSGGADAPANGGGVGAGPAGGSPEADETSTAGTNTAPGGTDRSAADNEEKIFEEAWGAAYVFNMIFGDMDARGATFGAGSARARRRTRYLAAEVERAVADFVSPPPFEPACTTLRERRLVIVVGPSGIGRHTSALALLQRVAGPGDVVDLPPVLTFGALADLPFDKGHAFLVQERAASDTESELRFDLDRLHEALVAADAYVVITQDGVGVRRVRELGDVTVSWECPDPAGVLAVALAGLAEPVGDLTELYARIHDLRPAKVREIADRIRVDGAAAIADLDALLGDPESDRVAEWFVRQPSRAAVLEVAALAFVPDLPEWQFEEMLYLLLGHTLPADDEEPWRASLDAPLAQRRAERTAYGAFVRTQHRSDPFDDAAAPRRRVAFSGDRHRRPVLMELHARYGPELWVPLRRWLEDLVEDSSWDVRLRFTQALAVLADVTFAEVYDAFLDRWSRGPAAARVSASWVLTWMCGDERTTALALQTAMTWARRGTALQQQTALFAFGLELGVRFPREVLPELWRGMLGSQARRRVASRSFGQLFTASFDDPALGERVLRYLHKVLVREIDRGRPRGRDAALDAAATVLAAIAPDGGTAIAHLLMRSPALTERAARCWAEALSRTHHQTPAARSLLEAVATPPTAQRVVFAARLGAAVVAHLTEDDDVVRIRECLAEAPGAAERRDRVPEPALTALLGAFVTGSTAQRDGTHEDTPDLGDTEDER